MHHPVIKASFEAGALIGVVGTLMGYLPYIAAALSIAWYIFAFYKEFRK